MLSLDIYNPSLYEDITDNNLSDEVGILKHLLDRHILPGLDIKELNSEGYTVLAYVLNECGANAQQACEEKKVKIKEDKYHPSIILKCKKVQTKIIFFLRDNGIGIHSSGTSFKVNILQDPNHGIGEQTLKKIGSKLGIKYKRISKEYGSVVKLVLDIQRYI